MKTFNISSINDLEQLKNFDATKNVYFCFGNREDLITKLQQETSHSKIIGCTTSGAVYNSLITNPDESLVVNILELKDTETRVFMESFSDYDDSYQCGVKIGKKLSAHDDLAGVIVLSEGLLMNSVDFTKGLNEENKWNAPVMGGLAADNLKFEITKTFNNESILTKTVVAIGFYGKKFHMKTFSASGIKSFGIERRVTKSVKNVVYEIDNKPALDVYEKFLGKELKHYQAGKELNFPIEISENFETKEGLIRTPLLINREEKTIAFTSEIPENSMIRLMMAIKNDLILAAESVDGQIVSYAKENNIKEYSSFIVSCAARQIVMGEEIHMELPSHSNQQFGFYAYGEFAPINSSCDLVNQTFTQGMLYEE